MSEDADGQRRWANTYRERWEEALAEIGRLRDDAHTFEVALLAVRRDYGGTHTSTCAHLGPETPRGSHLPCDCSLGKVRAALAKTIGEE
jgi:hypothetical protein